MDEKKLEQETQKLVKKMQTPAWKKQMEKYRIINQAECYEDAKDIVELLDRMEKGEFNTKSSKCTFKVKESEQDNSLTTL